MRSPSASYLNKRWGRDAEWMGKIGASAPVYSPEVANLHIVAVNDNSIPLIESNVMAKKVKREACTSLGVLVERVSSNCWRNSKYACNAGKGTITPNKECQQCSEYIEKKKVD